MGSANVDVFFSHGGGAADSGILGKCFKSKFRVGKGKKLPPNGQ